MRVLPAAVLGPGPDGLLVASAAPTVPHGWCALLPNVLKRGVAACTPRYEWPMHTHVCRCRMMSRHRPHTPRPSSVLHEATASLLRPVAIPWQPPFSLLLPPAGVGHRDDEVSRQLLHTGSWQPGHSLHVQHPHPLSTLLDALVRPLMQEL